MALKFTPHTITVESVIEGTVQGDKSVPVPSFNAPVSVQGMMAPEKADVTHIATFGAELKNPHRFFGNPEDVRKFPLEARVNWTDDYGTDHKFAVKVPGSAALFNQGLPGDHFSALLEELETQ